jgi:glycosyltransferase involved in cell wall biosynthesis
MIKIVYIINSLGNSGGMERVLSSKANWLASSDLYEVTVITKEDNNEGFFFDLNKNIIIDSLNLRPSKNKIRNLFLNTDNHKYKKKITQKLFEIKPDITISMFGDEYEFLHTIKDGSKKIIEFHFSKNYLSHLMANIPNLSFRKLRQLYARYLQYKQYRVILKYDKFVLLTKKDQMLWGNPSNSCVIPNPLSFISNKKSNCEQKEVIAIGRLIAQKGFDLLIKTFSLINKSNPDWKLTIYGEGQDRDYLLGLIENYNLQGVILLKPPTKNIKDMLLNSSILAFSSRYEGFGLVLTEAMECGLPCISFDCECGPSEIICHNEDGFLVNNFNLNSFASFLNILMNDEALRKDMGEKAIMNVKRFYIDDLMKSWQSVFYDLLPKKSKK